MSRFAPELESCTHSPTRSATTSLSPALPSSRKFGLSLRQRLRYSLRTLFSLGGMTILLAFLMLLINPVQAAENLLKTSYFTANLGASWQTVGTVHNNPHSVNINFVNRGAQSTLNVVVGSGKIQPYALLVDMQKALRQQGAKVGPILQKSSLLYFEFTLNGLGGYSCSATNGQDVSSITILGNPQAGLNFVRQFTDRDPDLFPDI